MKVQIVAAVSLLALTGTSASSGSGKKSAIDWIPCYITKDDLNNTAPVLCGSLAVPLDYTDPGCGTNIDLPLFKIPAANNASKSTILMNFGGPGANGTQAFIAAGGRLRDIVGRDNDIVTWHPRGTQGNILFSCYANQTARRAAQEDILLGDASPTALEELWTDAESLSNLCYQAQQANGTLIGTSFTAHDMMRIVDALEEDGLLHYYGISYGTVIGATAAALYPERMGRVCLDGNVNTQEYFHNYALRGFQSVDDVFFGFCQGCAATPERCPLAGNNTATELRDSLYGFLDNLKDNPIQTTTPDGKSFTINYSLVKSYFYISLFTPSGPTGFPYAANIIYGLLNKNYTLFIDEFPSLTTPVEDAESYQGIKCGDTFPRSHELQEVVPYIDALHNVSVIGGDADDSLILDCARWKTAAKGRPHNFQVKPRNPPLIIGNTYDPATPLVSSRNVSAALKGSVLLQQNGYGHTSLGQASLCTAKAINAYFANGTLPQTGTVCQVDEPLFVADGGKAAWANIVRTILSE